MKRTVTAIVLLLCLAFALVRPEVKAAGSVYFTAIMDELQPLKTETMPTSINGLWYIPYTFFSSEVLGVYFIPGSDKVMLYSAGGLRTLTFDIPRSTVFDQNGAQYYIPAQKINGLIYVPVDRVCDFFGLTYKVIQTEPAYIIRFKKGDPVYNDKTFPSLNRTKMQAYYEAYTGTPGPTASPGTSPSPSPQATYENVTVYLSYYGLTRDSFKNMLDALDAYGYKCCFFVTSEEIAAEADLLRRAAGTGHSIGIWLTDGTFDEYREASALLFEAAKLRTVLVSAAGDTAGAAKAAAEAGGLVFWSPTRTYDAAAKLTLAGLTGKLNVLSGSRESVNFECTDSAADLTGQFFAYLSGNKYSIRRITERTWPIPSID